MNKRRSKGNALIESIVGVGIVFVPLVLFAADLAVMFHAAHANEEFAEQLARLCSTLPDQANAAKACTDVVKQYRLPANISKLEFSNLVFDAGLQEVSLTTSMIVSMPVPFPGYERITVSANVKQPIVSVPVAR
ncbi:MAG: hypothetical protein DKT66_22915 [Candidatus Melainabacteria bacterium]|nr:MAG: hypothetical protein DKT66_22915 [Candidatus Melainabacteria bacterium]